MSALTVIAAVDNACHRLAMHARELMEAHDLHGIAPGPHDDLTTSSFAAAAEPVYRASLSDDYLTRIGLSFGAVDVLMQTLGRGAPDHANDPRWQGVMSYFRHAAERYAPDYIDRFHELPSLSLLTQQTPSLVRFDLLAGLASRLGAMQLFDAASWVGEAVVDHPGTDEVELDPAGVSALASLTAIES